MRLSCLLVAVVLAGCAAPAPTVTPGPTIEPTPPAEAEPSAPTSSPSRSPEASPELTARDLRDAVEVSDIRGHLQELQRIADENGGNRATSTTGFDASVGYVADRLIEAGYQVTRQTFTVGDTSSVNLVVERAGTDPEVIMLGAHLDSVQAGPGINDNGSGVATLLVIAERLAELPAPRSTVRIALWGAEEGGPRGSPAYVDALSATELARIGAYLNFDMLGSTNPIRFVYAEAGAAPGSDALTALFTSYFDGAGLPWASIDLGGHSDHGAFTDAGIPTGGLFSGGREPKTEEQAAMFGGAAGAPADPCSDQACDTIDNIDDAFLDGMADAIAHVVATLAS
jgi:aminopeptidase S